MQIIITIIVIIVVAIIIVNIIIISQRYKTVAIRLGYK